MILHDVRVHPSKANLKREDQLAWKIAGVAADKVPVEKDVAAMIVNRIIDNASVAIASANRHAIVSARDMAFGTSAQECRDCVRRAVGEDRQSGMGGLGQRYRGARARHARHVPGRGLLASRRQHPAGPRGRADHGQVGPRPAPRHRHRLRDPHRSRPRDQPAQAPDRPHHPSLPWPGGRHRHTAGFEAGGDLPGGAAGGACQRHHASVAQGPDQFVESLCARTCRQACGRGGGPRHARRRRSEPDLRRRGFGDCLGARRTRCALSRAAAGAR